MQQTKCITRYNVVSLSSIDPKVIHRVKSKIKQSMIEVELLKRGIVRPEPTFDEDDYAFDSYCNEVDRIYDSITVPDDCIFVCLCTHKGEGMGFAVYEDVKHLHVFVDKSPQSFDLYDYL